MIRLSDLNKLEGEAENTDWRVTFLRDWFKKNPKMAMLLFHLDPDKINWSYHYLLDNIKIALESDKAKMRELSQDILVYAIARNPNFFEELKDLMIAYIHSIVHGNILNKDLIEKLEKDILNKEGIFFFQEIDTEFNSLSHYLTKLSPQQCAMLWMWYFIGSNPKKYIDTMLEGNGHPGIFFQNFLLVEHLLDGDEVSLKDVVDETSHSFITTFVAVVTVAEIASAVRAKVYDELQEANPLIKPEELMRSEELRNTLEKALANQWYQLLGISVETPSE